MSVVLPLPLGPSRHTTSPAAIARSTWAPTARSRKPIAQSARRERHARPLEGEGEERDEDRRADERGGHTRRNFGAEGGAAERVHGEHEGGAEHERRAAARARRARPRAGARRAGSRGPPIRWCRRATTAERWRASAHTITARRSQPTCNPRERASSSESESTSMRQRSSASGTRPMAIGNECRGQVARQGAREAAQQPEGDRRQLVVGIGDVLHQRDAGAEERAHDHTGEHEREQRIAPADPRADRRPRGPRR